jgi:nucleolin
VYFGRMMRIFVFILTLAVTTQAFRSLGRFNMGIKRSVLWVADEIESTEASPEDSHSVYVGNIPFTVGEDELISLIDEKAGTSYESVRLVIDKRSGRSRGFAYVNYDDKEVAEAAVEALQGINLDSRDVRVELSTPGRDKRPPRQRQDETKSIFVGNIDFDVTEEQLRDLIESTTGEGSIDNIRLAKDRMTGRPRGFGHVVFITEDMVDTAIEKLNGAELGSRSIRVDKAQRKEDRPVKFSIYLGNLAWDVTEELVKEMIDDVLGEGLYQNVRLALDRETGRHRGFGYVDFKTEDAASSAIAELSGLEVLGRQLRADMARPQSERRPRRDGGGGGSYNRGGYGNSDGGYRGSRDSIGDRGDDDFGSW